MAFRDELQKEKKKLSRLSFGEKLQYIFDYYKFWILGVVVLVGLDDPPQQADGLLCDAAQCRRPGPFRSGG